MKNLKYVLMAGLSFGVFGGFQVTANAASQYSAKRSHEVKLIWRRSMGTHAFKAPTGARFSKHLGVCYGYNPQTADVTWYTDAHEKLYLKNLRMYSIYYHVTSKSGLQGWIWKGYMKPVNGTTSNPGNGNSGSGTSSINNSTQSTNSKVQDVLSLFPGTNYSKAASAFIDADPEEIVQDPDPRNAKQKQDSVSIMHSTTLDDYVPVIHQLKTNQISFKQYVINDLKKQGINSNNYAGYTIGISCNDNIGDYGILLYR